MSEKPHSAHERVCQGCPVSETACSAHGWVFRVGLVSETARSAHERVCRCASGRRRVCVVTEESRHPYLRNSALHHRATKWYESVAQACLAALSGDDKCQKRCPGVSSWSGARNVGTLFHRHRDDGCPGVSCRLGVARGRILERSKEHKWMVLLLSKTKTHTTVALYGENAAVVIGQGSGGAFQGI